MMEHVKADTNTKITVDFDVVLVYAEAQKTDACGIADLFRTLSASDIRTDLIGLIPPRRTPGGLSFSVASCDFSRMLKAAAQTRSRHTDMRIEVCGGYSRVMLHRPETAHASHPAADFLTAMCEADSEIMLLASSDAAIGVLVRTDELDKTVAALERAFPQAKVTYIE